MLIKASILLKVKTKKGGVTTSLSFFLNIHSPTYHTYTTYITYNTYSTLSSLTQGSRMLRQA
nr:MAG TPA: hypothetical protein [Caudoviricetes sp.]